MCFENRRGNVTFLTIAGTNLVSRGWNIHETRFLLLHVDAECLQCAQSIFDFDETPEIYLEVQCPLCKASLHKKCLEGHLVTHPRPIVNMDDLIIFQNAWGISSADIIVDRCLFCRRTRLISDVWEQICEECRGTLRTQSARTTLFNHS